MTTLPGHNNPWQEWPPPPGQKAEIEIQVPGPDERPVPVVAKLDEWRWRYEATGLPVVPAPWRPLALEAPSPWKASIDESMGRIKAAAGRLIVRAEVLSAQPGETSGILLENFAASVESLAEGAGKAIVSLEDIALAQETSHET